jgi:integrase
MWRILLLTGARVSEMLALEKADIVPAGLRIDESAYKGEGAHTKNRKILYAPLPESLRRELEQWASTVPGHPLLPSSIGRMQSRNGSVIQNLLKRARAATGLQDLDFRQCRTTFATLYEGDPRDAQAILGHHSAKFTLEVYKKPIAMRQQAGVDAGSPGYQGRS